MQKYFRGYIIRKLNRKKIYENLESNRKKAGNLLIIMFKTFVVRSRYFRIIGSSSDAELNEIDFSFLDQLESEISSLAVEELSTESPAVVNTDYLSQENSVENTVTDNEDTTTRNVENAVPEIPSTWNFSNQVTQSLFEKARRNMRPKKKIINNSQ